MSKRNTPSLKPSRSVPLALVIDDNEDNVLFACGSLELLNFRCIVASSGASAIDLAKDKLPDLILMDIVMPEMDGISVTQSLKNNPLTNHIPVIAVTGLALSAQREQIMTGGCDDYLCKPYMIEELSEKIANFLDLSAFDLYAGSCVN